MATSYREAVVFIGKRVRAERHNLGLSQGALAQRCGVDRATLARLELGMVGEHGFGLKQIFRAAAAMNLSLADLVPQSRCVS